MESVLDSNHVAGRMKFIDRTVQWLSRVFPEPAVTSASLEDEQAHLELLQESSSRIQSTIRNIEDGGLAATLSPVVNRQVEDHSHFRPTTLFANNTQTSLGAVGSPQTSKHTGRLNAEDKGGGIIR